MPCNIIWLTRAQIDMDALYKFYSRKSEQAAVNIHNGIIDETDRLANNPCMVPIEPAITKAQKTYRSLVVSNGRFKVIYFVENETVYIARVWGCKQDDSKLKPL
jgi:plasmid stabilization system protein ParE